MSNALTAFINSSNLPSLSGDALADSLDNISGGGPGGTKYLSFSGKSGALTYDRDALDPEKLFLVEPQAVFAGWICWKGGTRAGSYEWSIHSPKAAVAEEDLEDFGPYNEKAGEGWKATLGFGMVDMDNGSAVKFSTGAKISINVMRELLREVSQRTRAGEPSLPVVSFDSESIVWKGMKNHKLVIHVDRWLTRDEAEELLA